jgi:hypothetical protein
MSFVYSLFHPLTIPFSNFPFFLIFPLLTVSSSQSPSYSPKFILISYWYSLSNPSISLFSPLHLFRPFSFNSFVFSVPLFLSYCSYLFFSSYTAKNLDLCIPRKGFARPQCQFPNSCVCERSIYSHVRHTYFLQQNRQTDQRNRPQKHE